MSVSVWFLPARAHPDGTDPGYDPQVTRDLLSEFECDWKISPKGTFIEINHTRRWTIERT